MAAEPKNNWTFRQQRAQRHHVAVLIRKAEAGSLLPGA
jgi:hypothetical protein